ncbi:MAG TPA: hypothetical protein VE913_21350 [Longimicrobium sp.]|nr:hypothetical protein [Longimicrobium sp.]
MSIVLGVNAFAARGAAADRQARALAAWPDMEGVRLVNLQWADEVHEVPHFQTLPILVSDARAAAGVDGRRLPIVRECMDRLAGHAAAVGAHAFAYANSDVALTRAAVELIRAGRHDAWAFSRMDVDPATGHELEVVTRGVDVVAARVDWWSAHRHRFRPYPAGEPVWDNVYAALLLAHGDSVLLNRGAWVLHERHAPGNWRASPYARYIQYLAALDRPYFSLWAEYHAGLTGLRARGAGEDEELHLQREVFRRRPGPRARVVQAARAAKATVRWIVRR